MARAARDVGLLLAWPEPDSLYTVDERGTVERSADGGGHRDVVGTLGTAPEAVTAASDGTLYAAGRDDTVAVSRDGGRTLAGEAAAGLAAGGQADLRRDGQVRRRPAGGERRTSPAPSSSRPRPRPSAGTRAAPASPRGDLLARVRVDGREAGEPAHRAVDGAVGPARVHLHDLAPGRAPVLRTRTVTATASPASASAGASRPVYSHVV